MRRTPTDRRGGFTLVELLVVITILAILFALTAAAVVRVIGKGDEVRVRNEISQLQNAVQAFKTDFQVPYIPDRLILPPGDDPTGESLQYISRLWPRINTAYLAKNNAQARTFWGVPPGNNTILILQGHQALVFFLGGARDASGIPIGFSTDGTDPLDKIAVASNRPPSQTRKGPYFEFPPPNSGRLRRFPFATPPQNWTSTVTAVTDNSFSTTDPYWSFIDIYGQAPYIYFSSKKTGNDYVNNWLQTPSTQNAQYDLQFGVAPFQLTTTRYANPTGFQIISAGRDVTFGSGGLNWAGAGGGATATGADDMANFHPTLLGVTQE